MDAEHIEKLTRLLGRPVALVAPPLRVSYPRRQVSREVAKSLAGVLSCLALLLFLKPAAFVWWPVFFMGLLFFFYMLQQTLRLFLGLELKESELQLLLGNLRLGVRWSQLENLRLHFYPNSRGSANGTLVLTIKEGWKRIKLDSNLEHFPTMLAHAAAAARQRQIKLHPTTVANLEQLGL